MVFDRKRAMSPRGTMPRVLVAEDDPDFRQLVVSRLLDDGCEVYEAASGVDLLRLLSSPEWEAGPVDLLIMDHRMPGSTGLQVIRHLRARHFTAPCILMSAFPEPKLWDEAEELGATLLSKPFALGVLSEIASLALMGDVSGLYGNPRTRGRL